jgi:hypothetical protein
MTTPPRSPFVAGAGHLTMIRERATAGNIKSTDVFNLLTTAENLRAFVEQIARGEIRHTCPAARALLGMPVVTDARDVIELDGPESVAVIDAIGDMVRRMNNDEAGAMIALAPKGD